MIDLYSYSYSEIFIDSLSLAEQKFYHCMQIVSYTYKLVTVCNAFNVTSHIIVIRNARRLYNRVTVGVAIPAIKQPDSYYTSAWFCNRTVVAIRLGNWIGENSGNPSGRPVV